ncbi:CLUMA_CG012782, isoform A [Clunio marinus]|uniref:CLUMA_CG012782, isoform A n=1 Tax=Clunio marinus TaxID=568069 RepID=A0A1J1ILG9_9DIPT|nr:CLUMA_CG012782, isoform A [Clunio marinus]
MGHAKLLMTIKHRTATDAFHLRPKEITFDLTRKELKNLSWHEKKNKNMRKINFMINSRERLININVRVLLNKTQVFAVQAENMQKYYINYA